MELDNSRRVLKWDEASKKYLLEIARRTDSATGPESQYHRDVRTKLARVAKDCGFTHLSDVTYEKFSAFLGELARAGRSPATQNEYLQKMASFLEWCVKQRWIQTSPLAQMDPVKVGQAGRRRLRRPFTEEELERLCRAGTRWRAMVYRVAAFSGFRRKELLRLRKEDCTPVGPKPRWHVDAARTENGCAVSLPMAPERAESLWQHWTQLPVGSPLFPRGGDREMFRLACGVPTNLRLRADRIKAEIPHQDERSRYVDFHSLRYTFCVLMARHYPIEIVSRFMRHAKMDLTVNVYLDLGLDREGEGEWVLSRLSEKPVPTASPTAGTEYAGNSQKTA